VQPAPAAFPRTCRPIGGAPDRRGARSEGRPIGGKVAVIALHGGKVPCLARPRVLRGARAVTGTSASRRSRSRGAPTLGVATPRQASADPAPHRRLEAIVRGIKQTRPRAPSNPCRPAAPRALRPAARVRWPCSPRTRPPQRSASSAFAASSGAPAATAPRRTGTTAYERLVRTGRRRSAAAGLRRANLPLEDVRRRWETLPTSLDQAGPHRDVSLLEWIASGAHRQIPRAGVVGKV